MNSTSIIVSLGGLAVATAVGGKIASALGEMDIAQYIKVAGVSASGLTAIGIIMKLLSMLKGL